MGKGEYALYFAVGPFLKYLKKSLSGDRTMVVSPSARLVS
jgi:hypothetical protein